MEFENVSLDELDKIENLFKCNIHIFGCNKKFITLLNSKKNIRKSKSDFDKDLDLLLIDDIKPNKLMPPFIKYMKFENLKNCILNNWIIHNDFECIIDPITKEHSFEDIIWNVEIINLVKKFKLFII